VGEKNLRIATALVTALLCGVPLFSPRVSQAASSATRNDVGCFSYTAPRASNAVCNYGFMQPFVLKGYSKGGPSTLSYAVQCRKGTSGPMNKALVDRRIWYKRSTTVSGTFEIRGVKDAVPAARHCVPAQGMGPVLTISLKMGRGTTRTNLAITLDSSLPWGN
jgi:hypothetical protein